MTRAQFPPPGISDQFETFLANATDVIKGHSAWLDWLDPVTGQLFCASVHHTPTISRGMEYGSTNIPAKKVVQTQEPLMIDAWEGDGDPLAVELGEMPLACLPVLSNDSLIGVLNFTRSEPFGSLDIHLLSMFAQQARVLIENADLLDNASRKIEQSTRLNELTLAALEATDLATLTSEISNRMPKLIDADRGQIALYDERSRQVRPASGDAKVRDRFAKLRQAGRVKTLTEVVLERGKPVIIEDVRETTEISSQVAEALPVVAVLGLPLVIGNSKIGAAILGFEEVHHFTPEEVSLCEQAAVQIALAIAKMQALEDLEKRGRELEALRKAGLMLTSSLEIGPVLELIADQTLELVEADDTHIFLYDEGQLTFGVARWRHEKAQEPFLEPREKGLTRQVAESGGMIVVSDVNEHPLYDDWRWDGAIVGLPLRIGSRVVGVMNVALDKPHDFNDAELRVLQLLADQAAIMIENARLFERAVSERRRIQLLLDVSQQLAQLLDTDQIIERALQLIVENLGAWSGEFFTPEKGSDRLIIARSVRSDGMSLSVLQERANIRLEKGLIGWVAAHQEPAWSPDVQDDPRWLTYEGIDEAVGSAICQPLAKDGNLLGVIGVFHRDRDAFQETHLQLLGAIANQVLLTFINAQQYQTLERRLAEMTAIRQVVQVVNQRLEMESLLEEVVQQVGDVLGYPIVEIYLVTEDTLVLGAARGGLMDTDSRYSLDAGIVGKAVLSGQAVYVPDVEQEPAYIAAWRDTATEIAVPIIKEDVIIGVLNVESPEQGSLTVEDANLLSLLADQLSVAIENAALYQRLQVHADELEAQVVERTARLEVALEQARAAEKLKTQFVSDVSHELRTPLSNIRLYLDLLADGPTERHERYLETLSRETDRLVALIDDLLTISRLDTGSVILNIRAMDLNELALALVEDRQQLFREKDIDLQVDLDDNLPHIAADERMISQVLGNLMTNAMHYTPSGGRVRIRTKSPGMSGDSWATLMVEDTGLGIPEDEHDRIFERFYRGTASREVGSPGTGLGLAICKEILTQHGGTIRFESQLNEGTRFTVEIPLYVDDPSTD